MLSISYTRYAIGFSTCAHLYLKILSHFITNRRKINQIALHMYQMSILFSSILLSSFFITSALTLPPLHPLIQTTHTASSPLLFTDNNYNIHPNLTAPPPLAECHYIDDPRMSALSSTKCAFLTADTCSDLLATSGPETRGK